MPAFAKDLSTKTMSFAKGANYVGETWYGKKHGEGTMTWANGSKYAGQWNNGKKHGVGTLSEANGGKYEGEWKEDHFHGQGTYTFPDGGKYVGEYQDHKKHGQGTQTWPDGKTYEGEWENNEEREGTMTLVDGTVQKGRFVNRKFVEPPAGAPPGLLKSGTDLSPSAGAPPVAQPLVSTAEVQLQGVNAVNTDNDTAEEKTEGGAVGAPPVGAPPMQQSEPAAPPAGVQVQIPAGVGPGQQFTAQMPDGQQMAVTVPDGCQAGQVIQVDAPPAVGAPPTMQQHQQMMMMNMMMNQNNQPQQAAGPIIINNNNNNNNINITTVKGEGDWFAEGEVTPWCAWCCGYSACIPSIGTNCTCAFLYAAATLARRTSRPSPLLRPALYPLQVLQLLHGLLPARQRGVRLVLAEGLADVHRHHLLQDRGQLLLLRQHLRLPLPEGHPVPSHDLLLHALRQRRLRLLQEGRLRQGAHGQDGRAADGARHGALNKQTTTRLADDLAPKGPSRRRAQMSR